MARERSWGALGTLFIIMKNYSIEELREETGGDGTQSTTVNCVLGLGPSGAHLINFKLEG